MKHVPHASPPLPAKPGLLRYCLLCVLIWSAVVIGFAFWSITQERAYLMELTRQQARGAFEKDLLVHRWSAGLGEVYLPLTDDVRQSSLGPATSADVVSTATGLRLTRVVPAGMTRHLFDLQQQSSGTTSHLTSLNPRRSANRPDSWERASLLRFTRGDMEATTVATLAGEPHFRLMRPLVAEAFCLGCHSSKRYHVGDIIGGISVSFPMRRVYAVQAEQRNRTASGMGGMLLIGLSMIGIAFGRINHHQQVRIKTESALRDSEAEFRMLAENANDVIWTIDLDGKFSYVSRSVQRQMGYAPEELLRREIGETLAQLAATGSREVRDRGRRNKRRAPDQGGPPRRRALLQGRLARLVRRDLQRDLWSRR